MVRFPQIWGLGGEIIPVSSNAESVPIAIMQITIELPDDIAKQLQPDNVSRRVLELIAAACYRQGQIGAAEVRRMLNFSSA